MSEITNVKLDDNLNRHWKDGKKKMINLKLS
jgi:hypothetical protein